MIEVPIACHIEAIDPAERDRHFEACDGVAGCDREGGGAAYRIRVQISCPNSDFDGPGGVYRPGAFMLPLFPF